MTDADGDHPGTLDDMYCGLPFRDRFKLFRYGILADNALDDLGIKASHIESRLRRAVKIIAMFDGWSPQEVAGAISDVFFGPTSLPVLKRWADKGKFSVERLDQFPDLCIRAVKLAFGVDLHADLGDAEQTEKLFNNLPYPAALFGLRASILAKQESGLGEGEGRETETDEELDRLQADAGLSGASAGELGSILQTSGKANEIVEHYGHVLEMLGAEGYGLLYPLSRLPFPKSVIRDALDEQLRATPERFAEPIEIGLQCLDRFVPDEDIPANLDTDEGFKKVLEVLQRAKGVDR